MPETTNRILRAAKELFASRGFNATNTKEIAKRARVHEATLFRRFKGKREIFRSVLDAELERVRKTEEFARAIEIEDFRESMVEFVRVTMEAMASNDYIRLTLVLATEFTSREVDRLVTNFVMKRYAPLLARLRREHRARRLAVDPVIAARSLVLELYGFGVTRALWGSKYANAFKLRTTKPEELVEVWLRGVVRE